MASSGSPLKTHFCISNGCHYLMFCSSSFRFGKCIVVFMFGTLVNVLSIFSFWIDFRILRPPEPMITIRMILAVAHVIIVTDKIFSIIIAGDTALSSWFIHWDQFMISSTDHDWPSLTVINHYSTINNHYSTITNHPALILIVIDGWSSLTIISNHLIDMAVGQYTWNLVNIPQMTTHFSEWWKT